MPTVQRQYSNLQVSFMDKRMDMGLDSGPEPSLLLNQKEASVKLYAPLLSFQ